MPPKRPRAAWSITSRWSQALVETVGVAAEHARDDAGLGRHFLIENPVAQALRPPDLARTARQPHLERAAATERAGQRLLAHLTEAEAAGHQHHRREACQEGLPGQRLICRLQSIDSLRRHASVRPAALPSSRLSRRQDASVTVLTASRQNCVRLVTPAQRLSRQAVPARDPRQPLRQHGALQRLGEAGVHAGRARLGLVGVRRHWR